MTTTVTVQPPQVESLLEGIRAGKTGSLARAITWVENSEKGVDELLAGLSDRMGTGWRTGITGPPGAGKSTLADALARQWAADGRKPALLAVDPSSPFSGGALLGDRIRVDRASVDAGVFVRSMANRGSLGGLAIAAGATLDLFDAFGFDELLVETVGVGQAEVDIAAAADTTVVVLTPASGDGVQAMKAGLMEVADLFVINKADTPGADRIKHEIESSLEFRPADAPEVEVLMCSALNGDGVAEVAAAIGRRRQADRESGRLEARRRDRAFQRVRRLVLEALRSSIWQGGSREESARTALANGERPEAVASRLVAEILGEGGQQ